MTHRQFETVDAWIAQESIPFSVDDPLTLDTAVDKLIAALTDDVELLGLGEPLHAGKDFLIFRNRLFQHLVEAHGYDAIAIESSLPKSHIVNEYVAGRGPASYKDLQDTGFSHGFGKIEANKELVDWMRGYNADQTHPVKLHFYGFDSPTEMMSTDSPRQVLHFALDYLTSMNNASGQERRLRIDDLLGDDAAWENPAAAMDPAQSIGLSAAATALRIETEDLIAELEVHRPEFVARNDLSSFLEALQFASLARHLLNYHAELARQSPHRTAKLLGLRDAAMADNVAYIMAEEQKRGKVLVFAHNSHLQRGKTEWRLGENLLTWYPAGAHLSSMYGSRYAVIGAGLGESPVHGIGQPEANSLEAHTIAAPGPARFLPTHQGQGLPVTEIAALPVRNGSTRNPSYFAFSAHSLTDFDWLFILDSTGYEPGGGALTPDTTV